MRHRISGRKFGRDIKERNALFRSLTTSFVHHGFIETSLAKAKTVQPIVEKLATRARKSPIASFRKIHAFLQDRVATQKLIELIKTFSPHTSGLTSIERVGIRKGDAVPVVRLSWAHGVKKAEKIEKNVMKGSKA